MTSSNTDPTNSSLPVDKSQNDFESKVVNNINDDIDSIDDIAEPAAQDAAVENVDADNNSDKEVAKESAAAQAPDAKIKMETVAPDVVVASLETPETDSQAVDDHTESDFLSTEEDFFQDDSDAEVSVEADETDFSQQHSNDAQAHELTDEESFPENMEEKEALNQEQAAVPTAKPQAMNDEKNINKNKPPINKKQNSTQTAANVLEEDEVSDDNHKSDEEDNE